MAPHTETPIGRANETTAEEPGNNGSASVANPFRFIQCLYQSQNGLRKHGLASEREALDPVRGISDAFDHAWRTLSSGCSGLSVGSLAGDALGYELLAFLSPQRNRECLVPGLLLQAMFLFLAAVLGAKRSPAHNPEQLRLAYRDLTFTTSEEVSHSLHLFHSLALTTSFSFPSPPPPASGFISSLKDAGGL
ncbi:unnamed protein product [Leuciscus chuanchicus]